MVSDQLRNPSRQEARELAELQGARAMKQTPKLTTLTFQAVAMLTAQLALRTHRERCEECAESKCDTASILAREAGQAEVAG